MPQPCPSETGASGVILQEQRAKFLSFTHTPTSNYDTFWGNLTETVSKNLSNFSFSAEMQLEVIFNSDSVIFFQLLVILVILWLIRSNSIWNLLPLIMWNKFHPRVPVAVTQTKVGRWVGGGQGAGIMTYSAFYSQDPSLVCRPWLRIPWSQWVPGKGTSSVWRARCQGGVGKGLQEETWVSLRLKAIPSRLRGLSGCEEPNYTLSKCVNLCITPPW